MDWLAGLFKIHSDIESVVVISLIIAVGLGLGRIKVKGISLGVAFVFFVGIFVGHFGLSIDHTVLIYSETFGLALFVYCLGLHVGPNFFGSLRHEGLDVNLWSLFIILFGTIFAVCLVPITGIKLPDMVGVLCGATTNTPALGAATQAMAHLGLPSGSLALATAVTYPLGVLGVIVVMVVMRKAFVKPRDLVVKPLSEDDETYIAQFVVINPALEDKTIADLTHMTHLKFIVSRLWRTGQVIIPEADTVLHINDIVMVVTTKDDEESLVLLFGKLKKNWNEGKINWNAIDAKVESRVLVVSRTVLNGKRLGQLHLRDTYDVNVSRVIRGDIKLLATSDLRLQYGDRVTVVGTHDAIDNVEKFFGNSVKTLNEPNLCSIFIGLLLGLALGTIPIHIPGIESPIRLGIAGGPIIMGIIVGALGPQLHFISYTTRSASLMLRKFGLSIYLACLGLDAGKDFFATVMKPEGVIWIVVGFLITVIPCLIIGLIALKTKKYDFGTICGILCGSMANPMALGYANDTLKGDSSSVSYASVYPLGMFIRVIIAQVLIMFFV
ncbi:MAG: putative transporter [Prevotella sp.]|jgi:AspT/YidE/YbjL antiporter-like protein|nr:putative transporter [Prevotella sp.]MCH3992791.1 putative transporter [Prevotella sp.]MCI1472832.1 putative transporter [Prevotella sp.]MCI1518223.1 putative transporter [Prevotella sp.]MCI1548594.1 putative transporter [Prevotella sp.]MCI1595577.1 putative transporter [Prevotella sp.]